MANILLDYDGTLHESIHIYAPAFRKAIDYLHGKDLITKQHYTDKEISKWLGLTAQDMWRQFAPHIAQEEQEVCSKLIGDEMCALTQKGYAKLYPQTIATLKQLKEKGHTLIFLSNCKIDYMDAHRKYFALDHYFEAFYCSEQFGFIPKYKLFDHIKQAFSGEFIVVGDRLQDIEVAIKHELEAIGCVYGYGHESEWCHASRVALEVSDIVALCDNL